jgi:hypothetical protein
MVTVPVVMRLTVEAESEEEARLKAIGPEDSDKWESALWDDGEPYILWSEAEGLDDVEIKKG